MPKANDFVGDWYSVPGATIGQLLNERQLSVTRFAKKAGRSEPFVRELLTGTAEIDESVAESLARLLGGSVEFWLNRESQYRQDVERFEERLSEQDCKVWLKELPYRDMVKRGWIVNGASTKERARHCLDFFGLASIKSWRKSCEEALKVAPLRTTQTFENCPGATAAWLRRGEAEAFRIETGNWNPVGFQESLQEARELSRTKSHEVFIPALQKLCARYGVALVVVRPPKGCRASGAAKELTGGRRLLLLSFRHLSDDQVWFTFFHEAGHLVLHDPSTTYVDDGRRNGTTVEQEANDFASDLLIPRRYRDELLTMKLDANDIIRFARRAGISPGIVVGQLQFHGRLKHNQMNNLKRRYMME